ncbi:MAG: hypothetical protein JXA93_05230 [Anaerolineae bacterium]|nr:hypothetical protein [Anaerolineae bacterium]
MKRKTLLCLLSGILVLSVGLSAFAQSSGGYDLVRSSIDGARTSFTATAVTTPTLP